MNDKQFLQDLDSLRGEWSDLLGDQDANTLAAWRDGTNDDDPESVRQTINRVWKLFQQHPQAQARANNLMSSKGVFRSFKPTAGGPDDIRPGTLMVCPEEPDHYQKRLRQKGQLLSCPQHRVLLVPADSLETK